MTPMRKLTRQEYDDLYIAYTEAMEAASDLGGKHALLMMVLQRLGYNTRSWQEAEKTACNLLEEGWGDESR